MADCESAPGGTVTVTVCPLSTVDTVPPAAAVIAFDRVAVAGAAGVTTGAGDAVTPGFGVGVELTPGFGVAGVTPGIAPVDAVLDPPPPPHPASTIADAK